MCGRSSNHHTGSAWLGQESPTFPIWGCLAHPFLFHAHVSTTYILETNLRFCGLTRIFLFNSCTDTKLRAAIAPRQAVSALGNLLPQSRTCNDFIHLQRIARKLRGILNTNPIDATTPSVGLSVTWVHVILVEPWRLQDGASLHEVRRTGYLRQRDCSLSPRLRLTDF